MLINEEPAVLPLNAKAVRGTRTRAGMSAAGFLSLLLMEREGEAIPDNVQRFDEPEGPLLPERSPELLLALLLYAQLSPKKRDSIRSAIRGLAYGEVLDPAALQLNNLLSRRGLPASRRVK
jgi:hypothetical protein